MTTRRLPRPLWALLAVAAVLAVLVPLLVLTVRLPLGDTLLLPGTEQGGVRVVSSDPVELSFGVDVRNVGMVPVRVQGASPQDLGPYAVRLGRGVPGGGVPEEESFAPFTLWPGQQRLVVAHLTRAGGPADVRINRFSLDTTVLGLDRQLAVHLPTTVEVRTAG